VQSIVVVGQVYVMGLFRKVAGDSSNVTTRDQRQLLDSTDSHLAPDIKSDADNGM
jgi:hypothetical protein